MLDFMFSHPMGFIALLTTFFSVASGLYAMTLSNVWTQADGWRPILKGDVSAILYTLVTVSTIISVLHMALLTDWVLRDGRDAIGGLLNDTWMAWHSATSMFFTWVHYVVIRFRLKRVERDEQPSPPEGLIDTLWGKEEG